MRLTDPASERLQLHAELVDGAAHHARIVREILARVGNKWTVTLLRALSTGPQRYGALRALVPELGGMGVVSKRMLTLRLRELQRYGLIDRRHCADNRVKYGLTEFGNGVLLCVRDTEQFIRTYLIAASDLRSLVAVASEVPDVIAGVPVRA